MELIDPFDGLGDLAAGRLRTPLDPEVSFGDDPLRMFRAAALRRRASRSSPTPRWWPRSSAMHGRLSIVSAERIRDELDKMVMVDVPSAALWFVVRTGLAARVPPRAARPGARTGPDPPPQGRAGAHAWPWSTRPRTDRVLRLAALFHDVGKPRTRAITDGGVSFHHHEVVGARMTRDAHGGAALPGRRRRHRGPAGRAAPALPHLPPGLDRQGGAPLRPRRRPAASTCSTS